MLARLWGTRGSLPAAGAATLRYGGNTSCVEVRADEGGLIVLDAGSGIRELGLQIDPAIRRIDVFLTHLHMDHLQGLAFFAPLYEPAREVHIWGPPARDAHLGARLTRYLSPPLFPVRLRNLPCHLELHEVPRGSFEVCGTSIVAQRICHPGLTVGYRIEGRSGSLAYLPDHEPFLGAREIPSPARWTSGSDLADGATILIHDAQYTEQEYRERVGWGHSATPHVAAFARLVGVERLVPFHHDPSHSDEDLDLLMASLRDEADDVEVTPGIEGMSIAC